MLIFFSVVKSMFNRQIVVFMVLHVLEDLRGSCYEPKVCENVVILFMQNDSIGL